MYSLTLPTFIPINILIIGAVAQAGKTVIDTEGQDGQRVQTIQQTVVNGEVESETIVNDEVVVEPVDQVVRVGTQRRE